MSTEQIGDGVQFFRWRAEEPELVGLPTAVVVYAELQATGPETADLCVYPERSVTILASAEADGYAVTNGGTPIWVRTVSPPILRGSLVRMYAKDSPEGPVTDVIPPEEARSTT